MNSDQLSRILCWLKAHNAHQEEGQIAIPKEFREMVIEIVGDNQSFRQGLDQNLILKNYLYQRILLNKDYAYKLEESWWGEQFHLLQDKKMYFNNIKQREIDPNESTDFQIRDKCHAWDMLEYLTTLELFLENKMRDSVLWQNQLVYLIG